MMVLVLVYQDISLLKLVKASHAQRLQIVILLAKRAPVPSRTIV
jgi:hypothetical protein